MPEATPENFAALPLQQTGAMKDTPAGIKWEAGIVTPVSGAPSFKRAD
jgi:hypothetical protein